MLGYSITTKSLDDCVFEITRWMERGDVIKYFVCANPHSLEVARKDLDFERAIRSSDLIIPDGIGIVLASRILGGSIRKRITGMDIFLELSRNLNKAGNYSYFFLGSTAETLSKIREKMRYDFPNITVAGTCSPPFKADFSKEDNRMMIEAINKSRPDVLWVGMTAPKQEKWVYRNKDRLHVKIIGPVGAVFDFYSGSMKRSHPAFQRLGFEWLPRFLREPRRLWKRNLVSNPLFLLRVMRERIVVSPKGSRRD